jgi:predicted RNA-binding protein with PUA domain
MCEAVRCPVCGKTTWAGCGSHIEEVRATVPAEQWCPGHESEHQSK